MPLQLNRNHVQVSSPVVLSDGVIYLQINQKPYKYKFDNDAYKSEQMFWSYWHSFSRNKGRFLSKIRKFLIADEHGKNIR